MSEVSTPGRWGAPLHAQEVAAHETTEVVEGQAVPHEELHRRGGAVPSTRLLPCRNGVCGFPDSLTRWESQVWNISPSAWSDFSSTSSGRTCRWNCLWGSPHPRLSARHRSSRSRTRTSSHSRRRSPQRGRSGYRQIAAAPPTCRRGAECAPADAPRAPARDHGAPSASRGALDAPRRPHCRESGRRRRRPHAPLVGAVSRMHPR